MTRIFRAYDSDLGEEYPKYRLYCVAYEPMWQSIRHELKWTQFENAVQSLARADAYVNLAFEEEKVYRTWRVYNLLCAIPHGQSTMHGIRMVERSATEILIPALDRYRDKINEVGFPTEWDWAHVRRQLEQMKSKMPDVLQKNVKALRRNRARRTDAKPELRHYLRMCEEAGI